MSGFDPHHDCKALAECVVKALGVNGAPETAEKIMRHAIAQECIALRQVEWVLERHQTNEDLSDAVYLVQAIRERLELAGECAGILANLLKPGSERAS